MDANEEQPAPPPAPSGGAVPPDPDAALASLAFWSFVIPVPFSALIIPLVLLNTKGKESPLVRDASVEALNFLIFTIIGFVICGILIFAFFLGLLLGGVLYLYIVIFSIIGAIQTMSATSDSPPFRFPLTIRFIN